MNVSGQSRPEREKLASALKRLFNFNDSVAPTEVGPCPQPVIVILFRQPVSLMAFDDAVETEIPRVARDDISVVGMTLQFCRNDI